MIGTRCLLGIAIAVTAFQGLPAQAQLPPFEETELRGEGSFRFGAFGTAVAVYGTTVLVGAPGEGPGAAYVFERTGGGWVRTARLTSDTPDTLESFRFGYSVALSGDTAVVGAPGEINGTGISSGAVYVFARSGGGWARQARLTAAAPAAGESFGYSVGLSGNVLAAGAPVFDIAGSPGAAEVFIFRRGAWRWQARLTPPDGEAGELFGGALALSRGTLVAGARRRDALGIPDAGAAYVFVRNLGAPWSLQARLTAAHPRPFDRLGYSVALDGDTAVAGAWLADRRGTYFSPFVLDAGAAYVFTRQGGTWSQQARLYAPDAEDGDHLGFAVAVAGDTLAAGAWLEDAAGNAAGALYLFRRQGQAWDFGAKLTASDTRTQDRFGAAVALADPLLVVGAFRASDLDFRSGAAYVFEPVL